MHLLLLSAIKQHLGCVNTTMYDVVVYVYLCLWVHIEKKKEW